MSIAAALQLAVNAAEGSGLPPDEVSRQVAEGAKRVLEFAPALVRQRLEEALLAPQADRALQWLHETGILARVLPEIEATVNFTQEGDRRHKDVWAHTKRVIIQAQARPAVRWAALLHDIGKVPTRAISGEGKVTFYGHPEVGARMFDRIARRLSFPKALRLEVRWLIQNHQRISQYESSWTDSAVRRFLRQMEPHMENLVLLSRADITSARQEKREAARRQVDELLQRIEAIREFDSRLPPLPSGIGNAIMERLQIKPGRVVGDLKRALEAAIEKGAIEAHQPAEYYLDYLSTSGLLPLER